MIPHPRPRLAAALAALWLATILSACVKAPAANRGPNIVFILADDLGYGDLSCYGATDVQTPNIDRLAREGMRFTDAHSPSSVCTPSRYNLMTGRYSWRTWAKNGAVWGNDPLLIEEGRMTIASLLRSAGYATGIVGKWHLGFGKPGMPGWDDVLGPDYNRKLVPGPLECGFDYSFVVPHVGAQPKFIVEGHQVLGLDPADPIRLIADPRPEFARSYLERPRTDNPNLTVTGGTAAAYPDDVLGVRLTEKAVDFMEKHQSEPFFLYFPHRNVHGPLAPASSFKGTSQIGLYGDFINELDWSVGQVLSTLGQLHLAEKTLVIFSSDNGGAWTYRAADPVETNGHRLNGPLRGGKTEVFEGGHRVPFLARWPGHIKAGATNGDLLALTDMLATFASLTHQQLPAGAGEDSFDQLPALLGTPARTPKRTTLVMDAFHGQHAIRQGPWKLIPFQGGGGWDWAPKSDPNVPPGQIYNVDDDPGETRNLYTEKPELVQILTDLLEQTLQGKRTHSPTTDVPPKGQIPGAE